MKPYDILVAGEINPDLVLTGDVTPAFGQAEKLVDSASFSIGSSSAIFACGAARLGLKVGFIGVCGDDLFGRFMLDEMARHQVDITPVIIDASVNTGMSVILSAASDRAILTHVGSMDCLRADQVTDELLARSRHIHVASPERAPPPVPQSRSRILVHLICSTKHREPLCRIKSVLG